MLKIAPQHTELDPTSASSVPAITREFVVTSTCAAPIQQPVKYATGGLSQNFVVALVAKEVKEYRSVERRFRELADRWQRETEFVSLTEDMVAHDAYQEIVSLGNQALPLLLRELRDNPDHWFEALECITGENPVPDDCRGDLGKVREYWLEWAEERDLP